MNNKTTWAEAKEACNRLRSEFFGGDVYEWCENVHNPLPSAIKVLLVHACAYDISSADVEVLKCAWRQINDDGGVRE